MIFILLAAIIGEDGLAAEEYRVPESVPEREDAPKANVEASSAKISQPEVGTPRGGCQHWIESLPVVITTPGLWCLANNLDAGENLTDAITVQVDDTIIDGMGFAIRGSTSPTTQSRGVIGYDIAGLTIRHLKVIGFNTGIIVADTTPLIAGSGIFESPRRAHRIEISDVDVERSTFQGMHVRADGVLIENSDVSYVGSTKTTPHAFATGIAVVGNNCTIRGNTIFGGEATGNGETLGISLYSGHGCLITGNRIAFERFQEYSRNFGIWARPQYGAIPFIEDNIVSGAHYAFGPYGAYRNNISTGTVCALFSRRSLTDDAFHDLGGNLSFRTVRSVMPGANECPDDVKFALKRYGARKNAETAYAVALAYAETDGSKYALQTLTWMVVAAHLGHQLAIPIAEAPASNGYDASLSNRARKAANGILNCGKPATSDPKLPKHR